ncbi:oligosaccharide repeat unit polymerase [Heyndrickxia coagulans]|nr:oligosaccharide repeat unit polymerase [Heyndrickxia coagulans]
MANFDVTQFLFIILWSLVLFGFIIWFFILYTKKRLITVLSSVVLMKLFIPLILMYPFASSDKNINTTGITAYQSYVGTINKAFIISLIGITCFIIGAYFASKTSNSHKLINFLCKGYGALFNKKDLSLFFFVLLFMFLIMYKIGFFQGGLDGRGFSMDNTAVRPMANFFYVSCSFFLMLTLSKFYEKKSYVVALFIIITLFFSLTSGTRGAVLDSILLFVFMYFNITSVNNKRFNLFKFLFGGLILLILTVYLGNIREGQYNLLVSLENSWNSIFYGNNFSDIRDFAWVLSGWNGIYLHGKSLISGYLSFIPSYIFPLRTEWSLGYFTVTAIGFDPTVHPGLRPGVFGESYFNFGILGVCVYGFFYGYAVNKLDLYVDKTLSSEKFNKQHIYKISFAYLMSNALFNFMVSTGFFNVYVILSFVSIGLIKYALRKKFHSHQKIKKIRAC